MLRAIGAEVVVAGENFRFGRAAAGDARAARAARLRRPDGADGGRRLLDRDPRLVRGGRRRRGRRDCSAGRPSSRGPSSLGDAAAGRSATRPRTSRSRPSCSCPRYGIYAGVGARPPRRDLDRREPALRRRRAADRAVPARLRGRPLRPAARRRALAAPARRAGVRERGRAVAQIARDVEATRVDATPFLTARNPAVPARQQSSATSGTQVSAKSGVFSHVRFAFGRRSPLLTVVESVRLPRMRLRVRESRPAAARSGRTRAVRTAATWAGCRRASVAAFTRSGCRATPTRITCRARRLTTLTPPK